MRSDKIVDFFDKIIDSPHYGTLVPDLLSAQASHLAAKSPFITALTTDRHSITTTTLTVVVAHTLASTFIVVLALLCYVYLSLHATTSSRPYTSHTSMAWFSGGTTNAALVNNLAKNGLINSERVKNAMLAVRALRLRSSPCYSLPAIVQLLFLQLSYPTSLIVATPMDRSTAPISHPTQRTKILPNRLALQPPSRLRTCTPQLLSPFCLTSTHRHEFSTLVAVLDTSLWCLRI